MDLIKVKATARANVRRTFDDNVNSTGNMVEMTFRDKTSHTSFLTVTMAADQLVGMLNCQEVGHDDETPVEVKIERVEYLNRRKTNETHWVYSHGYDAKEKNIQEAESIRATLEAATPGSLVTYFEDNIGNSHNRKKNEHGDDGYNVVFFTLHPPKSGE